MIETIITDTMQRKVTIRNRPHRKRVLIDIKNLVNENYPETSNPCWIWWDETISLTKEELQEILDKTEWE